MSPFMDWELTVAEKILPNSHITRGGRCWAGLSRAGEHESILLAKSMSFACNCGIESILLGGVLRPHFVFIFSFFGRIPPVQEFLHYRTLYYVGEGPFGFVENTIGELAKACGNHNRNQEISGIGHFADDQHEAGLFDKVCKRIQREHRLPARG